jgi:hypothetical protein
VVRFFSWRVAPRWARVVLLGMVAWMAVLVLALGLCGGIPLRARTVGTILATARRVEVYYRKTGGLPGKLADLPVPDGEAERTTDAWGQELIYSVAGADRFTLTSLGRDGVVGGSGEDEDLRRTFRIVRGEAEVEQ